MTDANSWLMSGGTPSVKFPSIGSGVRDALVVAEPEVTQQTDYSTGALKYWDDGKPMEQYVIRVQTEERDPNIPYDDGVRGIYVKGQNRPRLRDAVRAAGAPGVQKGGRITAVYTEDGEKKGNNNAPKLHSYVYTAPNAANANAFLNAPDSPAQSVNPQHAMAATSPPANTQTEVPAIMQQALRQAQNAAAPQNTPAPAQNTQPAAATGNGGLTEQQRALLAAVGIDPATLLGGQS